ncbi:MAG: ATP-binding cassette domain-containing protein, partial [Acidimicrobiales bacterium]|nr:ATP-binding cassette domain-containing protein [Acidimicrobiales bacterium]
AGAALAAAALLAGGVGVTGLALAGPASAVEGAEARGELGAGLVALATDAEELAAAGAYDEARADLDAVADRLDAVDVRQGRLGATVVGLGAAAPAAAAAAVIAAAGPAGAGLSGPALGVVALVPLAVMEMLAPTIAAGEAMARVQASAARVVALIRRPDPVAEPEHPAPAPSTGSLALEGVAVGWPDGPVELEGVDLAVAEGERAVVAGPSGSGKSTLAAAMVGFLAPRSGTYAVGGSPASAIGTDAVRELVTWCQQDPWFAATTVADNLRVARPDASDDELWAALAIVHLDAWARALPAGLDTPVSRDAGSLSGGERQRLALARALVGRRRAVVLDEPTAHLDAATAAAVLDDLLAATADRAVVLLGHADAEIGPRATVRLEPRAEGPTRAVATPR